MSADPSSLFTDHDWAHAALCRAYPPALADAMWHPDGTREDHTLADRAVTVCFSCPVRLECLEAGLDEPWGIWGGSRPNLRARYRSAQDRLKLVAEASEASARKKGLIP